MALIVVQNDTLDSVRAVIDTDALRDHELRGWVAVGPISDPSRQPLRTDSEQADFDAAEAERIKALLDEKPKSRRGASK